MAVIRLDNQVLKDVDLEAAEIAVRALNGVDRTLAQIELAGGSTLTVGGGPDRFLVECAENETDRWCVVDPLKGEEVVDIVLGGSLVDDFPARLCVTLEVVLEAVQVFIAEDGKRSQRLLWSVES
jgi:hypothetical protein